MAVLTHPFEGFEGIEEGGVKSAFGIAPYDVLQANAELLTRPEVPAAGRWHLVNHNENLP